MITHSLGIDIGGTNARGALVAVDPDQPGAVQVLAEHRQRVREDTSPAALASAIGALRKRCCHETGVDPAAVAAVGVGIAGQLSADHRVVVNGPNLGWRDVPFADLVEATLGDTPTIINNDLSAIAWGEHRCGGGKGHDDLLVVYVGTGVGSGLICDGRLYDGGRGKAGEVGHAKVVPGRAGRVCGCGDRGCLEAYIGGRYLELRVQADLNAGLAEELRDFLALPRQPVVDLRVMPSDIDQAAAADVPYARELWREVSDLFALVMSSCLALANPTGWLLGGGVLSACPGLRSQIIAHTAERTTGAIWRDLEPLTPTLGDRAGLIGAALLACEALR